MNNPESFSKYLFILAHPDDEVYTSVFISELVAKGKRVDVLYITDGNYGGLGEEREKEVFQSMDAIGVLRKSIHFLRIPEREFMKKVTEAQEKTLALAKELNPECVVSHDFEGGHNGHDAVSFCASSVARELNIPLYVFPTYHGWPEKRVWNRFVVGREATYTLTLDSNQKLLKEKVINAHKTQEGFWTLIRQSRDFDVFSSREVLRYIEKPIGYNEPPTNPIGYEYPGSKILFKDYISAIQNQGIK
ncbi:MAG: PIG-L family deacetylase [Candidatus Moraniibacteriota bacterium]